MARIPGIKYEKDAKGNKRYVRIDLKKHDAWITPQLQQLAALNQTEDEAYRAEFEKKWAEGITGDELRAQVHAFIESLPWDK